jgi:hypothetical protein
LLSRIFLSRLAQNLDPPDLSLSSNIAGMTGTCHSYSAIGWNGVTQTFFCSGWPPTAASQGDRITGQLPYLTSLVALFVRKILIANSVYLMTTRLSRFSIYFFLCQYGLFSFLYKFVHLIYFSNE